MKLKKNTGELSIGLKNDYICSELREKCFAFSEAKSRLGKEGILSSKQ